VVKNKEYDDYYKSCWQSGMYWMIEAQTLKVAADKIFDVWHDACQRFKDLKEEDGHLVTDIYYLTINAEMQLFPVYMLLMGYAFENLVKGIIICEMRRKDPDSIDKTNLGDLRLPWKDGIGSCEIGIHGFKKLFKTIYWNINFLDKEIILLEETEKCVIWGGKYPVPKFNGSSIDEVMIMGGIVDTGNERSQKHINVLYDKLLTKLIEELHPKTKELAL